MRYMANIVPLVGLGIRIVALSRPASHALAVEILRPAPNGSCAHGGGVMHSLCVGGWARSYSVRAPKLSA